MRWRDEPEPPLASPEPESKRLNAGFSTDATPDRLADWRTKRDKIADDLENIAESWRQNNFWYVATDGAGIMDSMFEAIREYDEIEGTDHFERMKKYRWTPPEEENSDGREKLSKYCIKLPRLKRTRTGISRKSRTGCYAVVTLHIDTDSPSELAELRELEDLVAQQGIRSYHGAQAATRD